MECLICGSDDIDFLTDEGDKFTVEKSHICTNCGLIFIHPVMDDVDNYYLHDEFSKDFRGCVEPDDEKRKSNEDLAKVRWDAMRGTVKTGGKLLEIGSSSGEFLNEAASSYESAYGIDASTGYALATNRKTPFEVFVGLFPDDLPDWMNGPFGAIVSFHTLEHVVDPRGFLNAVWDRLEDDGVFALEYPDVSRASLRPAFHPQYFQKSHLFDFSLFNLIPLLFQTGFEVVSFATYDGYPRDKNILLLCKKIQPIKDVVYDRKSAGELQDRIKIKFKKASIVKKDSLRIVHVASHHINVGDGAITSGIRRVIGEIFPNPVQYVNLDIVDFGYFGSEIPPELINSYEPDFVLVGGGGTIDGHQMRTLNGTAFTMSMEGIDKLDAPIGFVGLGHNQYRHQEFFNIDVLDRFLDFCYDRDIPFSVRDDGSFGRLSRMLLRDDIGDLISVVPDPGFFVEASENIPSPVFPLHDAPRVVVQLAVDAYKHRFGGDNTDYEKNSLDFINRMSTYVGYLIDMHGASVALATHTLSDLEAALLVLRNIDRKKSRMHVRITGVYHPVYAPMFFKTYAEADLVVGMRGHSVICAAGLGTPVIPISTHDKISGFSGQAGLSQWTLEPPLGDLGYNSLTSMTDSLLIGDDEKQLSIVADKTVDWHDELTTFLTRCLSAI